MGPPLGALLFGLAAALPAGLDAVTFLVSAALLVGTGSITDRQGVIGGLALYLARALRSVE
jgi:hypothetical protein